MIVRRDTNLLAFWVKTREKLILIEIENGGGMEDG